MKQKIAFITIVLLALFLRVWKLNENPPGLYWDEVAIGYNAYSLVETGKDEYGKSFPLLFESFEDFKLPGYIYTTAVFIKVLGLNEWAVRLPSVIFGVLTVFAAYFLAKELFPSWPKTFYLLPVAFLVTSPWHIQFSRPGFEANGGLSFTVLGIYFLVKARRQASSYLLAAILFVLSLYFYYSGRVFLPVFLITYFIFFRKEVIFAKKWVALSIAVAFLLFLPLGLKLFSSQGVNRLSQISIFSDEGVKNEVYNYSQKEGLSFSSRLFHNRYKEYFFIFAKNYLSHFSPGFLFFDGDPQERHSTRGLGMLYLWELPFLILGFLKLREYQTAAKIILPWLFLSPLPASLALPSPHALRSLVILPTFQIITALGVLETYLYLKEKHKWLVKPVIVVLAIVVSFSFISYLDNYWRHSKNQTAFSWADGHRQMLEFIKENEDKYIKIYITGEYWRPYIFGLFYLNFPPASYQEKISHSQFGKLYFGYAGYDTSDQYYDYSEVPSLEDLRSLNNSLLVLSPKETKIDNKIIKTIYSINGLEVFKLVETK
jgi:4-amino-4-deoxy-L-arabinose transferase-like glycosyltransferase